MIEIYQHLKMSRELALSSETLWLSSLYKELACEMMSAWVDENKSKISGANAA